MKLGAGPADEHAAFVKAGKVLARSERVRRERLDALIDRAEAACIPWGELSAIEQATRVAEEIRSFAGEVNDAYMEQRLYRRNFKISADDVAALWSLAEWAAYDVELAKWRGRDAENEAALQLFERAPEAVTTAAKARLDTAPKRPAKPKAQVPTGCPPMPTREEPAMWDELLGDFLRTRMGRRFDGGDEHVE